MKDPHFLVYFDLVDEVHIQMRKDQGEAPSRRLAAYFTEVLGVPAEAHYHHSHWHLCYPISKSPDENSSSYVQWKKHRVKASGIMALLQEWGIPGSVSYRRHNRGWESWEKRLAAEGFPPLTCPCGNDAFLSPSANPPHGPECPDCRNSRLKAKAP